VVLLFNVSHVATNISPTPYKNVEYRSACV